MRYYRYVLNPDGGYLHPAEADMMPEIDAEPKKVVHVSLLSDGDGVVVYEFEGEHDEVKGLVNEHPDVVEGEVFNVDDGNGDGKFNLYARFEPGPPVTELLEIADEHGLILDTPYEYTEEGGVEVTTVGKNERVQEALPDFMRITGQDATVLEQVGEYVPDEPEITRGLTERQREVVEAAVEVGYYDNPRTATHEDVAEKLDCTASTAGEHLRKAEAKVMPHTVERRG